MKLRSGPPSCEPAERVVVAGVAVLEAVDEEEVDRGAVPEVRGPRRKARPDLRGIRGSDSGGGVNAGREGAGAESQERCGAYGSSHVAATLSPSSSRTRSVSAAASRSDAPPTRSA